MTENKGPHCQGCGDPIKPGQKIMTTLKGAYHAEYEGCRQTAHAEAPSW